MSYEVYITEPGGHVLYWTEDAGTFREARELLLEQIGELVDGADDGERIEYTRARREIVRWQRNDGPDRCATYATRDFGIRGPT